MGRDVSSAEWTNEQRRQYREKVRQDLDVFEQMLTSSIFEDDRTTGMEIELNLVDENLDPSFNNVAVLEAIDDDSFQAELARFNIEVNVDPRNLAGHAMIPLEAAVEHALNEARERAASVGSSIIQIGVLPTLTPEHFTGEWMSPNRRYTALNESMMRARGEDMLIDINSPSGEHLAFHATSIAPESSCTSLQLHLQVAPAEFAAHWNASQALAGAQVAVCANSPFFCGKALWHETRIPLFQQATDTRPVELANQGVRPRVTFGDRWITSIFDLFEDNVRYYPALLPEVRDEDPVAVLESGRPPDLHELRLHNGTIYRWNRPIYDTAGGRPHLRIENRVLPAGPSVVDSLANSAFYFGAVHSFASEERPVWTQMSFSAATTNFRRGARDGIFGQVYWPAFNVLSPDELVLRHLLPAADAGLADLGVDAGVRERYLGIIEARCLTRQTGAVWQLEAVRRLEARGLDRPRALHQMLSHYMENMNANAPVHTWELPSDPA